METKLGWWVVTKVKTFLKKILTKKLFSKNVPGGLKRKENMKIGKTIWFLPKL